MTSKIIPPNRLKEIALQIVDGYTCYIGVYTAKIEYVANEPKNEKEIKENKKLLDRVEKKPDEFLKIGDLPTEDLLECMDDFANEIKDSKKAKQLKNALNRKNPTRNFMQEIQSDLEYSMYWDRFSTNWRADWVGEVIVKAYNH